MKWPVPIEGINMKITVVKKATVNAKPSGWCPMIVDDQQVVTK